MGLRRSTRLAANEDRLLSVSPPSCQAGLVRPFSLVLWPLQPLEIVLHIPSFYKTATFNVVPVTSGWTYISSNSDMQYKKNKAGNRNDHSRKQKVVKQ